jgi:hypothetical protein
MVDKNAWKEKNNRLHVHWVASRLMEEERSGSMRTESKPAAEAEFLRTASKASAWGVLRGDEGARNQFATSTR